MTLATAFSTVERTVARRENAKVNGSCAPYSSPAQPAFPISGSVAGGRAHRADPFRPGRIKPMSAPIRISLTASLALALTALGATAPAQAHDHGFDRADHWRQDDAGYGRYRDEDRGYGWRGDDQRRYDERSRYGTRYDVSYRSYQAYPGPAYPGYAAYRGRPAYRGDYRYSDCHNDGATGTIVGAIAGGLIGHSAAGRHGDHTAGTIIGGAIGAIAGRAIDKSGDRCR